MESFLKVDLDKCIGCGRCAEECVAGAIALGDCGPQVALNYCIACGHCLAVCPTAALDNENCPLEGQEPGRPYPDSQTVEFMLRSRRSIRCYEDKPVPRSLVEKLLNMARFAPTGGNTQGLSYLALDDPALLGDITRATIAWMEDLIAQGSVQAPFMENFTTRYRNEGRDVILWGAPCLILATAQPGKRIPSPRENAIFSLLYAQLYAPALGLGSCWAGAVEMAAASGHQALAEVLKPYGATKLAAALMLGYPRHEYYRLVDREPLDLRWGD